MLLLENTDQGFFFPPYSPSTPHRTCSSCKVHQIQTHRNVSYWDQTFITGGPAMGTLSWTGIVAPSWSPTPLILIPPTQILSCSHDTPDPKFPKQTQTEKAIHHGYESFPSKPSSLKHSSLQGFHYATICREKML